MIGNMPLKSTLWISRESAHGAARVTEMNLTMCGKTLANDGGELSIL